ncbi:alpha-2-macroglobulin-like [Amblyraja radiata]|uniref:alpha-2-macroglobulin-like n=1 Tax=Amblyraja radiata TaxID=386614 RepID=UPI0014026D03|nr:alpha-2-macroglobulin-like [Amblyraja radiata]
MRPPGGLPGSEVGIYLRSAPGGICGIRVVDKSVALKDPDQELTVERVFTQLAFPDLTGYRYNVNDREPNTCIDKPVYSKFIAPDYSSTDLGDTYNAVKELGLKIFTNIEVKRQILCYTQTTHFRGFLKCLQSILIQVPTSPVKVSSSSTN